jgi:hypothetical protein
VAYKAFVVTEKIQKRLKAKQRQQEQRLLLSRAYLSFVGSSFVAFSILKIKRQIYRFYFY